MALHLMTMNVQMLPWAVVSAWQGMNDEAVSKANRIADDIVAMPPIRRPEVIAFNEVFNEDGRERLILRLGGMYPHRVERVGGLGLDDAGLMLLSIFPFVDIPGHGKVYKHTYVARAGEDALTAKGFAAVRIATPTDATTIVFTHLQASADGAAEDQYSEVRALQLMEIFASFTSIFASDAGFAGRVILCGDLNIRGDSGAQTLEWSTVFGTPPGGTPFGPVLDGWMTYMPPPGSTTMYDEGYTNINFKSGAKARLDYMCFARPGVGDIRLVPHRMFNGFNQQSDHFGLNAVIALPSPHCNPSSAIDLFASASGMQATPGNPSKEFVVNLNFPVVGGYQWIYINKPCTVSVFPSNGLLAKVFEQSDMTTEAKYIDVISWQDLPSNLTSPAGHSWQGTSRGEVYVIREPSFVALTRNDLNTGPGFVKIVEHAGESKATAIGLRLQGSVDTTFPPGQVLGANDTCWFKAVIAPIYSELPRDETFSVSNDDGVDLKIEFEDDGDGGNQASGTAGAVNPLNLILPLKATSLFYIGVKRSDTQHVGFKVTWRSPVSYLCLDQPLYLHVDDETGVDRLGQDEPQMQIGIDQDSLFMGKWRGANTGQRWPNLDKSIRDKVNQIFPGARTIGYVESISIAYIEPDVAARSWQSAFIGGVAGTTIAVPLVPGKPTQSDIPLVLSVDDDTPLDGTYSFHCTVSILPR